MFAFDASLPRGFFLRVDSKHLETEKPTLVLANPAMIELKRSLLFRSAYVVNLTKPRKLQASKGKVREWESRNAVINRSIALLAR